MNVAPQNAVFDDRMDRHKVGGQFQVIQINETMVSHSHAWVGQTLARQGEWLLGGIDMSTRRAFAVRVSGTSRKDLIPLIRRFAKDDSQLWTDYWRGYLGLDEDFFQYGRVNHQENFVDPLTGVQTQMIDKFWDDLKDNISTYMASVGQIDREIAWFLYKKANFKPDHQWTDMVLRITRDMARVWPSRLNQTPLELPDWVTIFIKEDACDPVKVNEWKALTHGKSPVVGLNVLGIGYEDFCETECQYCNH